MIQRDHIQLKYRLEFKSSFHCGTGLTNGLIHRAVQRDNDGYLYVPGSTIKGVLRETCEHISNVVGIPVIDDPHDEDKAMQSYIEEPDIVECVFGSRYQESSIFFDNAWMIGEHKSFFDSSSLSENTKNYRSMQIENRTQTRLSRLTRTVMGGALYTSEFGISELEFEGKIHGWLEGISNPFSDDLPGSYPLFLLIAGMCITNRIGANRSTGMGYCQFNIKELMVNGTIQENSTAYSEKVETFFLYEDVKKEMQSCKPSLS